VLANADTGADAARARRFGAEGIGLVRTEHMFLGERRQLVEDLILAQTDQDRRRALAALEALQTSDFVEILAAMDGLPVTIRTIDPPLHEFLPDLTDLSVKVALEGDKANLVAGRQRQQRGVAGLRLAADAGGLPPCGQQAGAEEPEVGVIRRHGLVHRLDRGEVPVPSP